MKKQMNLGIIGCSTYILENVLDIFSVRSDVFKNFYFFTENEAEKSLISKYFDDFAIPTFFVEDIEIFIEKIDVLIIGSGFVPDAGFLRKIIQNQIHIFIEDDFDFCLSSEHKYLYDLSLVKNVVIVKNNIAKYHVSYKNLENSINANVGLVREIKLDIFFSNNRHDINLTKMKKMIYNRLTFLKKIFNEKYVISSKDFEKKIVVAIFEKANVQVQISFSQVDIPNVVDSIKIRLEGEDSFHAFRCKEIYSMTSLSHLVHNFIYRATSGILTDKDELVFPKLLD